MMRGVLVAGAAVLMVVAVACSGPQAESGADESLAGAPEAEQSTGPVVLDPVDWATPTVVEGIGGAMEVTPTGVRYVTSEEISSPTDHDHPAREMFAVVRFSVTTDADAVTVPHGWGWRHEGQEYGPGDGGNASTAPWAGSIPEVTTETVMLAGDQPAGYVTFDLPDSGGELVFTGEDGTMVRWTAPGQDEGEVPELDEWLTSQP